MEPEPIAPPAVYSPPVAANPPPSRPAAPRPGTQGTGVVMSRGSWTRAAPIMSRISPMNGISRITIHHSAIPNDDLRTQADVARALEGIRRSHVTRRGEPFGDIGYHYIIDPQGRVWEGRALSLQGAHVAAQNEHNLGIMLMGHFERQQPTPAALASLDGFVASQMSRYRVPVSRVYTHQEIGKSACPGRNLQRYMDTTRSRGTLARA
jgi:N-acetylmuramoyl-L-alanine amidase